MEPHDFEGSPTGHPVPIQDTDPRFGPWEHVAFVPDPLPATTPDLSALTFNAVASARAALASLDSSARRLPDPALLRRPSLRREAQSTSALEGTFSPLEEVYAADEAAVPVNTNLREVLNYVRAAEHAFAWTADGRTLTLGLLTDLQRQLVVGTPADTDQAGRVRDIQVMIGAHQGARVTDARFVPRPPGPELDGQLRDLLQWMTAAQDAIDPVVAAALAHYQFECLHPFNDGNGRIGRLLIVLHLMGQGVLGEPTLTVSPWFEARRADYFDHLLAVSARGAWDGWVRFFADGLASSARSTEAQLTALIDVQAMLKARIRAAGLRADKALQVVDYCIAQTVFTVRQLQASSGSPTRERTPWSASSSRPRFSSSTTRASTTGSSPPRTSLRFCSAASNSALVHRLVAPEALTASAAAR